DLGAVAGRQQEIRRADGPQQRRRQAGAEAAQPGTDEDGDEQRRKGKRVTQHRVEQPAEDDRDGDARRRQPVAQNVSLEKTPHGLLGFAEWGIDERRGGLPLPATSILAVREPLTGTVAFRSAKGGPFAERKATIIGSATYFFRSSSLTSSA